jgi:hypothetical protein
MKGLYERLQKDGVTVSYVTVVNGRDELGKRTQAWKSFSTREEAEKYLVTGEHKKKYQEHKKNQCRWHNRKFAWRHIGPMTWTGSWSHSDKKSRMYCDGCYKRIHVFNQYHSGVWRKESWRTAKYQLKQVKRLVNSPELTQLLREGSELRLISRIWPADL